MFTEHRTEWSKTCDATQTKSDNMLMGQPTSLIPKQWSSGTQAISATNKQNKIKIQIKRQWKYQP